MQAKVEHMSYDQWPLLNNDRPSAQSAAEQPAPDGPINEMQRGDAERQLHQAFRDGRITTTDFEERFTKAMNATQLGQLRAALENIPAPVQQAMVSVHQQYRSHTGQQRPGQWTPAIPQQNESGAAMLTHLSGLISWIIGPAIIYGSSRPGSVVRREAAKAFNFQLLSSILFIVGAVIFGTFGLGGLVALMWFGWFGLTIAGGVMAGRGDDWTNPLNSWVKVNPLPTDGR